VVFSITLSAVQGSARLASGSLAEEIGRLRTEPGEGAIAIGGATLAADAAALGLIDEYRARVYPVLVGGGTPFFPQHERRQNLELVDTRTFSSTVVYLHYRVAPARRVRLRHPARTADRRFRSSAVAQLAQKRMTMTSGLPVLALDSAGLELSSDSATATAHPPPRVPTQELDVLERC